MIVIEPTPYDFYTMRELFDSMSFYSHTDSTPKAYPLESITEHQRKILINYLDAKYKTVNREEPVSFVRLLICDKPGMVLTPLEMPSAIDYTPKITTTDLVEAFGLTYTECSNGDLYVARSSQWLSLVPNEQADNFHRKMGVFLGYSQPDIKHYMNSEVNTTLPEDIVTDGMFTAEEVGYTVFLPQRFDDSIEGYKRAIQRGKEIYNHVITFAEEQDISELDQYVRTLYKLTCSEYIQ